MGVPKIFSHLDAKELRNGDYRMKCPFRENHTDGSGRKSFFISSELGTYHCFSCGAKGGAINLLTTKFKVSYSDAVELIKIGEITNEFPAYDEVENNSLDLPTYLPDTVLTWSRPPRVFIKKGLTVETLRKFRVGVNEIDGRLISTLPLYQFKRLVGVKYRAPGKQFWYSKGFSKDKFLYNEPVDYEKVMLVEGETDTMMSYQNGIEWAAGTLGTEVTTNQCKRISRFKNTYFAFDNDNPGLIATEWTYLKLRRYTNTLFVPYTSEDPGSASKEDLQYAVKHACDYSTYSMEMIKHLGDSYLEILDNIEREVKKKRLAF